MLSVLLKILAVIGIILLVILGIILLILLTVLFVPITYRLFGEINDAHKKANVRANWLWGVLRFNLDYSENLTWKLKILWFDLTEAVKKNSQVSGETSPPDETAVPHAKEPAKVQETCEKITYYLNVLQETDTKDLILNCFGVTGKILKSIRPRKLKVEAVIGFDSPDTTGKIYGLLCMLYPYYGNDIHITPDFENKIMEGKLLVSGRIYICVLLWNALRILLNRKLFKVIHKFKNGGKSKNGR